MLLPITLAPGIDPVITLDVKYDELVAVLLPDTVVVFTVAAVFVVVAELAVLIETVVAAELVVVSELVEAAEDEVDELGDMLDVLNLLDADVVEVDVEAIDTLLIVDKGEEFNDGDAVEELLEVVDEDEALLLTERSSAK